MTVYGLNETPLFPPAELADESGVLAIGGDLSPERLLAAYTGGIFPWFNEDDPIIWWSPDPRFVLFPEKLKISKTMRQVMDRKIFNITFDASFRQVVTECSRPRRKQATTWITEDMINAYTNLHDIGFAHSVEAWKDGKLAGGLYGVSLGNIFFGESMFSRESNASKAAFIHLVMKLKKLNFSMVDCQVHTSHLQSLGAESIARSQFLSLLDAGLQHHTYMGSWNKLREFTG